MTDENWALSFAFPDQSPAYARGFDGGRMWEAMKRRAPFEMTLVADRREDCISIATANGFRERVEELNADWIKVLFTPENPIQ